MTTLHPSRMLLNAFEHIANEHGMVLTMSDSMSPNGTMNYYLSFLPNARTFKPVAEVRIHDGFGTYHIEPWGCTREALGWAFDGWDNPELVDDDSSMSRPKPKKPRVRWTAAQLDDPIRLISEYIAGLQ